MGVVSSYGFDGSRFESQCGKEVLSSSYPSRQPLRHNHSLVKCVLSVFRRGEAARAWR